MRRVSFLILFVEKSSNQFKAKQVSTGGGAVIRRKNWGYISHGVSVWIDVEIPELVRRLLKNADDLSLRPILAEAATSDDTTKALNDKLNSLYSKRKDLYGQADIRLRVQGGAEETGKLTLV